jgi:glyoxylase-like metal-dependent hydrolase (beta-lactamase superfamily II)
MTARVHHLGCGTLCPRGEYFVHGRGSLFGRARLVCHVLLVETRSGLALVDTGIGAADVRDPRRLGWAFVRRNAPRLDTAETAVAQVRALGYRMADVRHLVPTHLDVDHAGGLPDFPDASVHVLRAELEAARSSSSERYRAIHFAHGPRWVPHDVGGERWLGFEAVRAIAGTDDEVLLVPLIGHTRGHAGVAVRTAEGWLLHAGDAYFSHLEMDVEHPTTPLGLALFQRRYAVDDVARRRNQERLRRLVREHRQEVAVFCAHSRTELERAQAARGGAAISTA